MKTILDSICTTIALVLALMFLPNLASATSLNGCETVKNTNGNYLNLVDPTCISDATHRSDYLTDADKKAAEESGGTDDPLHTITVKDRMGHMQAALTAPPFTPEHEARAREVAELLRAHGEWEGGEFVTLEIDGHQFVIVDIGMRMLSPRELFRAQGFPDDYAIDGTWQQNTAGEWHWHTFPKDVQVSCCGNSVCPPLAEALVRSNCAHLIANPETKEVAA